MKKILSVILAVLILFSLSVSAFAENELNKKIAAGKKYLMENTNEAETFDETLSYAEAGLINEMTKIYTVTPDEMESKKLAEYILLQRAFGASIRISEDSAEDYGDKLIILQSSDGTFGDLEATILSVAALLAIDKKTDSSDLNKYDDARAVVSIISEQEENGQIGNIELSAKAGAILWKYKDKERAQKALDDLEKYFIDISKDSNDLKVLAISLMALCDITYGEESEEVKMLTEKVMALQNEDGSFGDSISDSKLGFMALETVRYGVSPFNAIVNRVQFKETVVDWDVLNPLIILYVVLAVLAIGLWIFILKRKPKRVTLEDSKRLSEEKLGKIE